MRLARTNEGRVGSPLSAQDSEALRVLMDGPAMHIAVRLGLPAGWQ